MLRWVNEDLDEEIRGLKSVAETFFNEMVMAVNGVNYIIEFLKRQISKIAHF